MEYVIVKVRVPLFIAEEPIKSNKSWVAALIAPGVFPILQMDFVELAVVKC